MLLGININHFFVTPRILGTAISQLTLAIYFAAIALFGGVLLAGLIFSTQYSLGVIRLIAVLHPSQFLIFVLKNLLFGMIIAATLKKWSALSMQQKDWTNARQQLQRALDVRLSMYDRTHTIRDLDNMAQTEIALGDAAAAQRSTQLAE